MAVRYVRITAHESRGKVLRLVIAIACLAAAGSAGLLSAAGPASSASQRGLRQSACHDVGADAGTAARTSALRCLINGVRTRKGLRPLARSKALQLVARRVLSVRCKRSSSGCGAAYEGILSQALRLHRYTGRVRYVFYDVSADPSGLLAYISRSQSWLSSAQYRDLGIAFRPAAAGSRHVWVVVAGYRF
jgi:hypothetical protein